MVLRRVRPAWATRWWTTTTNTACSACTGMRSSVSGAPCAAQPAGSWVKWHSAKAIGRFPSQNGKPTAWAIIRRKHLGRNPKKYCRWEIPNPHRHWDKQAKSFQVLSACGHPGLRRDDHKMQASGFLRHRLVENGREENHQRHDAHDGIGPLPIGACRTQEQINRRAKSPQQDRPKKSHRRLTPRLLDLVTVPYGQADIDGEAHETRKRKESQRDQRQRRQRYRPSRHRADRLQ